MKVSTVDWKSPNSAKEIAESLQHTGFVVLTNTGISERTIEHVYSDWREFFASEEKHGHLFGEDHSGYFPFKSENAKDSESKDLKEFFHVYRSNALPDPVCQETKMLFENLANLGAEVLMKIQTQLPDEIDDKLSEPLMSMALGSEKTLFRILHYPPLQNAEEETAVRAAPHEDINLITLLPAATQTGLQVKDNQGNWHEIETKPGQIVVNVGDMLQEATQGFFKSTTHRVVNPSGAEAKKSRYSMPLFVHPRPDVRLSDKYTADEYLNQRLKEIGLK